MTVFPQVDFCGQKISRLIVGGNTVSGTSHVDKAMDSAMEDYFTTDRVKAMLSRCEELGINALQMRGDKHILRIIREFRQEGGRLGWVAQTAREMASFETHIHTITAYHPILIYLHGYDTDDFFYAGNFTEITRRLAVIRQTGIPVGLCTHSPRVIEYSQKHRWDVDFYMCSVYNITHPERLKQAAADGSEDALFIDSDIPAMYEAIRSVDKPCLVFKILGATRRCQSRESVAFAFRECYMNIKKGDAAVVGMFPRDTDQVAENVKHALAAMEVL